MSTNTKIQEETLKIAQSIKNISELTVGQVKGETPKISPKPQRRVELYNGEPPQNNEGKVMIVFALKNEKCGVEDESDGKKFKCPQGLLVQRVKNAKFVRDELKQGGQLIYDEKDIRQYKFCTTHGPFGVPESW